jgi:Dolichyl-phosphate-mannose-protein mannosyltransferase
MTPQSDRPAVDRLMWALLLVLAVAALVRAWNITTWSMWEDEEGSIFWAHRPWEGFAGFSPIFFVALNQTLQVAGMSVGVARLLPAAAGLLSVALTYVCFRRWVSPVVALLAALFLAINLGHVFWSQSIRYYTTALVFQILAIYGFIDGFERDRISSLLWSTLALMLALWTHFSAVLLVPALVGYLLVAARWGEPAPGYRWRNYLVFAGAQAILLALFAWKIVQMHNLIAGWAIPSARDPVHVGTTLVAYFGVPLVGLGLLAPWLARNLPRRMLLLLCCISFIPALELLVIAQLNLVNVTWYYALIAMIGFALLAAASLVGLWQSGRRNGAAVLAAASVLYYCGFLLAYQTVMHGDRPRWDEAAQFLKAEVGIHAGAGQHSPVYASVPGVVAFYLGADPSRPETYAIVQPMPEEPNGGEGWYVVEAKLVSSQFREWFETQCALRARFDCKAGPVDRSVLVYQHGPESASVAVTARP